MSKDKIEVSMNVYDIPIVVEALEKANKEIERLNKKIEQYENPEDMTLMFMWCDEKAKDEIKRLNNIIENITTMTVNGDRTQIKNTAQYKIDKAIEYIESYINQFNGVYPIADMRYLDLHKLLDILKGEDKE